MKIKVDPEFEALLPPLLPHELEELEENIKRTRKIRVPLDVWRHGSEYVLLDGHNRKRIAERLGIKYAVNEIELEDRDEALDWIDKNQVGKRNLNPQQIEIVRGRVYERRKRRVGQHGAPRNSAKCAVSGNVTAEEVGEEFGVNQATVRRSHQLYKAVEELRPIVPDIDKLIASKQYASRLAVVQASEKAKTREEAVNIMNKRGISERTRTERRKGKPHEKRLPGKPLSERLSRGVEVLLSQAEAMSAIDFSPIAGSKIAVDSMEKVTHVIRLVSTLRRSLKEE